MPYKEFSHKPIIKLLNHIHSSILSNIYSYINVGIMTIFPSDYNGALLITIIGTS